MDNINYAENAENVGQKFNTGSAYVEGQYDFGDFLRRATDREISIRNAKLDAEREAIEKLPIYETDQTVNRLIADTPSSAEKTDLSDDLNGLFHATIKRFSEETQDAKPLAPELSDIKEKLEQNGYIATNTILYTIRNAMILNMPILVEGEPGVGKTSLAKALADGYELEMIKIQFYDGITNNDILYEYDYAKQMLYMNAIRDNINSDLKGLTANEALQKLSENGINFFDKNFLIERPLLKAISGDKKKVLLLDEVDKTSEETEYLLLEILDNYSITIPEYGTITCKPEATPIVFLTSNNYRDLSEALKRRCLYLYIEPKNINESKKIIAAKANVPEDFALQVAKKVEEIRRLNLKQKPSISDSINWATSLMKSLGVDAFADKEAIKASLGTILKNKTDIELASKTV